MFKKYRLQVLLFASFLTFSGCDFFGLFKSSSSSTQTTSLHGMQEYNPQRDKPFIEKQFKENWYWLISSPEYDIHDMLDTRSPNKYEPQNRGKLSVKVLYKEGTPVGFVTYYMQSTIKGHLFILGVDKQQRKKGYGTELSNYAFAELKKMGAKVISFVTRINNPGAQKLYTSLGFKETYRDDIFVHYRKDV